MGNVDWLPEELDPVVMRLARADQATYDLAEVALAWSRGPDDSGPLTLRQVERTKGYLDVEIKTVRPVPPLAWMLFSEAVHHMRAALDNIVFYLAEKEHGSTLTPEQARAVSMLVYDDSSKFESAVRKVATGRHQIAALGLQERLGRRLESLQPFNDAAMLPSLEPLLAAHMGVEISNAQPLALLRDYSNSDKHRQIQVAASGTYAHRDGTRGVPVKVAAPGVVLDRVKMGEYTPLNVFAVLQVERPDGVWVGPIAELDGIMGHVAGTVIPTLVTGIALPDLLPVHLDLTDNGATLRDRIESGGKDRAHKRSQVISARAYAEAAAQEYRFPEIEHEEP